MKLERSKPAQNVGKSEKEGGYAYPKLQTIPGNTGEHSSIQGESGTVQAKTC